MGFFFLLAHIYINVLFLRRPLLLTSQRPSQISTMNSQNKGDPPPYSFHPHKPKANSGKPHDVVDSAKNSSRVRLRDQDDLLSSLPSH